MQEDRLGGRGLLPIGLLLGLVALTSFGTILANSFGPFPPGAISPQVRCCHRQAKGLPQVMNMQCVFCDLETLDNHVGLGAK